jgi:hypothetical protein
MSRLGRRVLLLERRPWTLAIVAAIGMTLLLPSAVALYGPPDLLDGAIALGDARLALGLAALFAGSAGLFRVLLRRRRLAEESVDEEAIPSHPPPPLQEPPAPTRAHLR